MRRGAELGGGEKGLTWGNRAIEGMGAPTQDRGLGLGGRSCVGGVRRMEGGPGRKGRTPAGSSHRSREGQAGAEEAEPGWAGRPEGGAVGIKARRLPLDAARSRRNTLVCVSPTSEHIMAGPLRTPLLLLAAVALTLALAVAVSPGTSRRNAKSSLVGGALDADVNEEGVQQALNFALSEYNKASNDAYHSRAIRVVRARKQVRPPGLCHSRAMGAGRP